VVSEVPLDWTPWDRQQQLTRATLSAALADADLEVSDPRIRPVLGTSYGPHLELVEPVPLSRWSTTAAREAGCVMEPITVTTACSAGSDALVAGLGLLCTGAAEICVCGGVDVLTIGKRMGHSRLGTMSADDLRAFDVDRSGTLLGEGAAFVVLEQMHSARSRGATIRGILAGAGSANDAVSTVAPDPTGANVLLAVRRALRVAGIGPADIGVISAHGSGTPVNDDVEASAYTQMFGDLAQPPVVFATKGSFGHSLGATGAIEAVTVLQALETGLVPPVYALDEPIPQLGLPIPVGGPLPVGSGYGLSVTLGFGGFDTCLVFRGNARP
jgi:3-oxoacyl-[acyl-carrier-protein] synthase II